MTTVTVVRRPSVVCSTRKLQTVFTLPERRSSVSIIAERTALWFFSHKQVAQWFYTDPVGAVVWGYICFFIVMSFLMLPLIFFVTSFFFFGLIQGILLFSIVCIYHALEDKYHPNGRVGRRWPAFHSWIGSLWKAFARILPITVLKLAPDEEYSTRKFLFGYHPHGVLFYGPGVLAMNWDDFFPGTTCCNLMSTMCFVLPLFRQFCLWTGGIPATVQCAKRAVENYGSNLAVIPGGVAEMLFADPRPRKPTVVPGQQQAQSIEDNDLVNPEQISAVNQLPNDRKEVVLFLKQRKGFIRLALQLGLDLVPVFTHGELELYHQLQWGLSWRMRLSRFLKAPITVVWGHKIFLPFRRPLVVVVGHPIHVEKTEHPTVEQVEELHSKYVSALIQMFEETKEQAGYSDTTLVVR